MRPVGFVPRGGGGGGGRGDSNIKKVGVLVVLLRGVNFRKFLAFKVSLRVAREEMQQLFF